MEKFYEETKKVFGSKLSFRVLCGIGIVIVILLIFSAGIAVGFRKASFGAAWGEHYMQNFGMPTRQNFGLGANVFPNAHGATGKIIKTELPNIIVEDNNTEKTILVGDDTRIEKGRSRGEASDLKVDDFIVTIGSPNDKGMIEAKFIRILPNPELLNK
jgi:hypothetical protein